MSFMRAAGELAKGRMFDMPDLRDTIQENYFLLFFLNSHDIWECRFSFVCVFHCRIVDPSHAESEIVRHIMGKKCSARNCSFPCFFFFFFFKKQRSLR